MRSHAKAPSAGSTEGSGKSRGLFRRALATRGVSGDAKGTGARSSRLPLALVATLFASVALLLGIAVPAASAAPTAQPGYGFLGSFGSGSLQGFFEPPRNPVALDSHGNIFAADEYPGQSVAIFVPDATVGGTFLSRIAQGSYPRDLAIDPATDALYVQDVFGGTINRYISDGNSPPGYTLDPSFNVPVGRGIAVDPVTHDLLVADAGAEAIRRYDTSGALVATISTPGIAPQWIAIAPDGSVYVAQDSSTGIAHFSGTGTLLGEVQNVGAVRALAVDQSTGVLVADTGPLLKRYSPAGGIESESITHAANGIGLAIDGASGRLYEATGRSVNAYVPATVPGVEAPVVSTIGHHSAHVSAEVDPGVDPGAAPGSPPAAGSVARFEYSSDGGTTWKSTPDQTLGGPTTIEADITGLTINFDFLVRAKASNSLTSHTTSTVPFSTPETAPEVVTDIATDVSETSAVLNGTINPAGLPSTYHFEYGTTTAYGSRAPAGIEAVAGNERTDRRFGRTITGLAPGTTYHFRLVAQSSLGVTPGVDQTFATAVAGGIPHRAYEQVTPVDKHGIPIRDAVGQAKADGSAIAYATQGSSMSAPIFSLSMSLRDASDWSGGIDLDPPLSRPLGQLIPITTLAVSPDFSHTLVATNHRLSSDAVEDGPDRANLYVVDIATGVHTLIGTAPSGLLAFIGNGGGANFVAGAPDFSWIVFASEPSLLPGVPTSALYRWSTGGNLEVVSLLPHGEPVSVSMGDVTQPVVHSVSADGSRVYFVANSAGLEKGIFLREGNQVKAISVSHIPGDSATPHSAVLAGISKDGRYAFFASTEGKLTSDAPDEGFQEANMYRYDASDGGLEYLGAATRTVSPTYDTGNPIGVSDDGQTAYFRGVSNALVWRDGVVKNVAPSRLEGEQGGLYKNNRGYQGFMSPDGRFLAYELGNDPDYSTDDANSESKIYLYDSETDQRRCISCFPDGSPGYGQLPSPGKLISNRISQTVTNTGRVFFTSPAPLVAADVNGSKDVYEYKDGKNRLISPGNAPFNAIFTDISEDGSDVFFTTNQKLVGQDNDESVDVYDARIDGGLAKQNPPPPQECVRDDCKATPNAGPELPFGGSEALSGPGNVTGEARKRCAKGTHARKVKGKTRCVKQSKAKKKAKNAKRANTNRRQGR